MLADLKYAGRSLVKKPGFSAVAILTLALGIGASVAIFSVVNAVLLRPLPFTQPEKLTRICVGAEQCYWFSPPEYVEMKRELTAWRDIEAWVSTGVNIATAGDPTRVTASNVTGGLLSTLGVNAVLGRVITPQDAKPGASPVVVLSHGLWTRAFAGERSTVGREIQINGRTFTVIGVMPKGFQFPFGTLDVSDAWMPLPLDPANPGDRGAKYLNLVGRLKSGATLPQAQLQLDSLLGRWRKSFPAPGMYPEDIPVVARTLHEEMARGVRPVLRMLMAAVFFLLLIACMNVANLLLARAEARQSEISIRAALGGGLWRFARQFAAEGLILSFVGAGLGVFLAQGSLKLMLAINEAGISRAADIAIDGRVLLFALAISALTGLLFSLGPLIHVAKLNLQESMRSAAASTTDAAGRQRFRQVLVISQLALALVLLTGTGLMLRAFWKLQEVNAGFDPKALMTLSVGLPSGAGHPDRDFGTRLEQRLNALAGVESASLSTALPPVPTFPYRGIAVDVEGFEPSQEASVPQVEINGKLMTFVDFYQSVSGRYFDTLGIRLTEGRFFDGRDDAQAPKVAIVNQTTARAVWGNKSAVGQRVRHPSSTDWHTVVGVVADVKNDGLEKPTATEIYIPYSQPIPLGNKDIVHIAVRSRISPSALVNSVRREVARLDPTLPLLKARTMEEVMSASQSRPRFLTLLLTLFAGVAVVLAAVGVYGVISYSVARRTKEFGIRMALGARSGALLGLVLGRGALLAACGVAIGLVGAFALTRFLSGFLFGVTATDPMTFVSVSLLLSAIAILASYIPARRATKVDPLVALRAE